MFPTLRTLAKIPVLILGLPRNHPAVLTHPGVLNGEIEVAKLREGFEAMNREIAASRFEMTTVVCTPEGDLEDVVKAMKRKEWRAIMVGWGVRAHPELTPFFERLINLGHQHAPQAVFCFNTKPSTTLEALERVLPS